MGFDKEWIVTKDEIDKVIARLRAGGVFVEESYAAGSRTTWLFEDGAFVEREQDAYTCESHDGRYDEDALVAKLSRYPWAEFAAWGRGE